MRVIAGTARGASLCAPKGEATRPTSDRMKENLFNLLLTRVEGSRFLDLYSGSGAIAIEALSRGAAEAVMVENSPAAAAVIAKNLRKTKFGANAEIMRAPVSEAVPALFKKRRVFDIIFLDPPYLSGGAQEAVTLLERYPLLADGGVLIAERSAKSAPVSTAAFRVNRIKRYGGAQFVFYENEVI